MARTLVIKNVDFSVNKVTTVEIEEEIPCTGITLNSSTLSLNHIGGTSTLVATVVPADTTDVVVWNSSNTDVVTVAGGVVTAIGCGTANITAVCGAYSTTCEVTVTHIANVSRAINRYFGRSNSGYLNGGDLNNYAIGYSTVGSKAIASSDTSNNRHPFVIPHGATKMEITNAGDFSPYGFWLSSTQGVQGWEDVAICYPSDGFADIPSSAGNRTVIIPDRSAGDYEGMDAVAFVFRYRGSGSITQEMVDDIVITFTAD